MNIADKRSLYAEIFRLLGPADGWPSTQIMAGSGQPLHFPVPWARDSSLNFLLPVDELRSAPGRTLFREAHWGI